MRTIFGIRITDPSSTIFLATVYLGAGILAWMQVHSIFVQIFLCLVVIGISMLHGVVIGTALHQLILALRITRRQRAIKLLRPEIRTLVYVSIVVFLLVNWLILLYSCELFNITPRTLDIFVRTMIVLSVLFCGLILSMRWIAAESRKRNSFKNDN